MAKKHTKRCSAPLIIREKEIKTTRRYSLTLARMALTKKIYQQQGERGDREMGTCLHCWWECKLVQPLWRRVWGFLKKLKTELPYDPEILLLGIYPEKTVTRNDTCPSMSTATLLYNCQDMEAT